MIKKLFTILIILTLAFSAFAVEGYCEIINTTIIPNFGLGIFPAGVWYEFGIRGLDLIPNQQSKIFSVIKTELQVRDLDQNPTDGSIIKKPDLDGNNGDYFNYYVFLSEAGMFFTQGFYRSAKYDNNFISLSLGLKMHLEQAFSSFNIFGKKKETVFDNSKYFPSDASFFVGTPDLVGTGLLLTNSVDFSININDFFSSFKYKDGYKVAISISLAPWFLANKMNLLLPTVSDYIKFSIDSTYAKLLFNTGTHDGFSGFFQDDVNYQYLSGSAVPKHAQSISFRGTSIPNYNQIVVNNLSFNVVSPDFLVESNHIGLSVFWVEGFAFGNLNNSSDGSLYGFHLGSIGVEAKADFYNMFHCSMSLEYIYANVNGNSDGWKFSIGGYFSYSI